MTSNVRDLDAYRARLRPEPRNVFDLLNNGSVRVSLVGRMPIVLSPTEARQVLEALVGLGVGA